MGKRQFFGKVRGRVINNIDPILAGRLLVEVPAMPGWELNWAMPCMAHSGEKGRRDAIPPVGSNVWIEFEGGEPARPIWTGCFWEQGEVPFFGDPPQT